MGEITIQSLMREDGTFDYKRYQQAVRNWEEYGRFQGCGLLGKPAKQEQELKQISLGQGNRDQVFLSEEGLAMMKEMQENRKTTEDMEWVKPFSMNMTGTVTYVARLTEVGEELLTKGQERGAGLMGSAYDILRKEIVARYADPDYKPAIVVEEDGVTAHLMTAEEEIKILDEAYESIAEFQAASAREMAKFRGDHKFAQKIYEETKQEYLSAREAKYMDRLKQKVERIQNRQMQTKQGIFPAVKF
ncbi:MAG: hypothetical protein HFH41_07940 [Lachnospiraceae bacterium]|nr:hypothetical protein [Lachnospiraceae bacterium]